MSIVNKSDNPLMQTFAPMNRKDFIKQASLFGLVATNAPHALFSSISNHMKFQLLRNATCLIETGGKKLLIDPMLGAKSAYDPVPWTSNGIRNPTVDLPFSPQQLEKLINSVDAVLITHTHNDHWDKAAQALIPPNKHLLVQPEDAAKLANQGFTHVETVVTATTLGELTITRTSGQHGTGEIGKRMGTVSGFVISGGKKRIYVAGDTIWCDEVKAAITLHKPDVIVLNAGGARFDHGDPIIMTSADVVDVCRHAPEAMIICVHMEALNHCYLKRSDLRHQIAEHGFSKRCFVPNDGAEISLTN